MRGGHSWDLRNRLHSHFWPPYSRSPLKTVVPFVVENGSMDYTDKPGQRLVRGLLERRRNPRQKYGTGSFPQSTPGQRMPLD